MFVLIKDSLRPFPVDSVFRFPLVYQVFVYSPARLVLLLFIVRPDVRCQLRMFLLNFIERLYLPNAEVELRQPLVLAISSKTYCYVQIDFAILVFHLN